MGLFKKKEKEHVLITHPKPEKLESQPKKEPSKRPRRLGDERWRELSHQSMNAARKKKFCQYVYTKLAMAEFRTQESGFRSALFLTAEAICWYVNGCADDQLEDTVRNADSELYRLFPKNGRGFIIPPAMMRVVKKCQKELSLTDAELKNTMLKDMAEFEAPIQLYTNEEVVELFFLYRDGNERGIKKVVEGARKRALEEIRKGSAAKKRIFNK